MKKIIYSFLLIVFFAATFLGCKKGETSAPSVVGDLKAYPGKNRVKIEFTTPANAKSGKVFYSSGKFDVFSITDAATQSVIVEKLPEGEQTLRVVTLNAEGLISDPKAVTVNVYGNNYQNGLISRQLIKQSTISPTSVEIFFGKANEGEVEVRVTFTNISGVKDSLIMISALTSIVVNNIDLNKAYYYYSVFKPNPEAIDEFQTTKVDAKNAAMLNFEKDIWIIAGFSDEELSIGGKSALASNIIDNNVMTFWHSEIVATSAQMPHWITVDMKSNKKFNGFKFIQTQNLSEQGLAKGFKFETSNDNSTWINNMQGEFTTSRYKQTFTFTGPVVARYFKITILSGYNNAFWSQIAEVDLFNEANVSGENGETEPTIVPLVNAKSPFKGDGSDLLSILGAGRMQKVTGWTHNNNAYISFDKSNSSFSVFTAPVWGCSDVTNGKIYQTVNLQPGRYTLNIDAGGATALTAADVYGVVAKGETLPDYTTITTNSNVLGYSDLVKNQLLVNSISFTLTSASSVTIGIVYNTHDVYSTLGIPWSSMTFNGFELLIHQ